MPVNLKKFPHMTAKMRSTAINPSSLVSFKFWYESIGIDRATALEWRRIGVIKPTVRIMGTLFLTRDEIRRFEKWARTL